MTLRRQRTNLDRVAPFDALPQMLRHRADERGDQLAFRLLVAGRQAATLTYGALDDRARRIGAQLGAQLGPSAAPGSRAILLYPQDLDYISAFFGCLYAGVVAVPVYPPERSRPQRSRARLLALLDDSQPAAVLTTARILRQLQPVLDTIPGADRIRWLATDALSDAPADGFTPHESRPEALAFLQYTSGSTSRPKGVMLSHRNLLHNMAQIADTMRLGPQTHAVFWLPLYHDMGLIGNMLVPLFVGAAATFMSPVDFLAQPLRWLAAISDHRGTLSGGPNFGYELCLRKISPEQAEGLDLSSWATAFNGAEPIRAATLSAFAERFAPCGFRVETFRPTYGLAEATLMVSMGSEDRPPLVRCFDPDALAQGRAVPAPEGRTLVGCGPVAGDQVVAIVDPASGRMCEGDEIGEIWVAGGSMAQGYWGRGPLSEETFAATLAAHPGQRFMRTGDLGFFADGELFVAGRLKDLIIVRGRNHYPQDFEAAVEASSAQLRPGSSAAFAIEGPPSEGVCVVAELRRPPCEDGEAIWAAARAAVADASSVPLSRLVLLGPGSIPKTSSGKVRRSLTRRRLQAGDLEIVASWEVDRRGIGRENSLVATVASFVGRPVGEVGFDALIDDLALDSVARVELRDRLAEASGVQVPPERFGRVETVGELLALYADETAGRGPDSPVFSAASAASVALVSSDVQNPPDAPTATPALAPPAPTEDAHLVRAAAAGDGSLDVNLFNFRPVQLQAPRSQHELLALTAQLMRAAGSNAGSAADIEADIARYGVSPAIIAARQFNVLPTDGTPAPLTHPDPASAPRGLPLDERMGVYRRLVDRVIEQAYVAEPRVPDEIVHVTCSGYMAPSPVETFVSRRGWRNTAVTHAYHMGCYGAFPAVRMATGFLAAARALRPAAPWRVDIVHTELLSAHLDLTRTTPADIVTSTLFADGFVRYSAGATGELRRVGSAGLRVRAYREEIVTGSAPEMTWDLEPHQFHMFLSKNVPLFLGDVVVDFVERLCADAGLSFAAARSRLAFALHPGGSKIVDFLKARLGLTEAQVARSRAVLRRCGNMSSATVPHIWEDLLAAPDVEAGTPIVSLAFGPGLTAAGLVLEKVS